LDLDKKITTPKFLNPLPDSKNSHPSFLDLDKKITTPKFLNPLPDSKNSHPSFLDLDKKLTTPKILNPLPDSKNFYPSFLDLDKKFTTPKILTRLPTLKIRITPTTSPISHHTPLCTQHRTKAHRTHTDSFSSTSAIRILPPTAVDCC
jgi:hypothetical protein